MREYGKSILRPQFWIIQKKPPTSCVETGACLKWCPDLHLGRQRGENIVTIPRGIFLWEAEV